MPFPGPALYPGLQDIESLVFDPDDPIEISDHVDYWVESFEYTPARPKTEWAESADTDGGLPTNEDHYTNAEATLKIRVSQRGDKNEALDAIGAIVEKGQLARRMVMEGERGLAVQWTPKDSTRIGTLYLLECDDWNVLMNVTDDPGYMNNWPVFTVHLTFAPFIYGETVTESAVTVNEPVEGMTLDVAGDVRTPGTLVLTDTATQNRRQLTIAQGTDLTSPLYYGGTALVITNTSSTRVADADAYNGGTVIADLSGLFPGYQDFFKLSNLPHRGPFRVIVRVKSTADEEEIELRLKWRVGDGPWIANAAAVVLAFGTAAYAERDLGTVNVPPGSANLDVLVEARSDVVTGSSEGVRADFVEFMPADRYGVVEGEDIVTGGQTLSWYDGFNHGTAGDSLIGTSPELGSGNWAEAGDTDDWLLGGGGVTSRAPASADADLNTGQYATAGGTLAATTAEWRLNARHSGGGGSGGKEVRVGGIVRYVDTNNWLGVFLRVKRTGSGGFHKWLTLYKRVAGTVTKLKEVQAKDTALSVGTNSVAGAVKISVTAAGAIVVYTGPNVATPAATEQTFTTSDSALSTGNALDDGKAGIYHATDLGSAKGYGAVGDATVYSTISNTQFTYAIPSTGSLTLTGSEAFDSNNSPIPLRGASFVLEPGDNRLAFKTRRNKTGEADAGLSDTGTAVVSYEPAYLTHPGA